MFEQLETGIGLEIVLWLQMHSNPLMDALAQLLNALGGDLFIGVLGFIYWSINKALGKRLLFALFISLTLSLIVKELLQTPRPYTVSEQVTPLFTVDDSFGMPSGHVLSALVVWGYIALWLNTRRAKLFAIVYVLLQGWGRMVSGVHYPQDVIGGIVLGILCLWLYWRYAETVGKHCSAYSLPIQIILIIEVAILTLLLLMGDANGSVVAGIFLGASLGILAESRFVNFATQGSLSQHVIRYLLGLVVVAGVLIGLRVLFEQLEPAVIFRMIRYALTTFVAVALYPAIAIRLGIMGTEAESQSPEPTSM